MYNCITEGKNMIQDDQKKKKNPSYFLQLRYVLLNNSHLVEKEILLRKWEML